MYVSVCVNTCAWIINDMRSIALDICNKNANKRLKLH